MTHTFDLRVYYEDTDLAGIVYYANYLKFIERARTEFVRELGIDQTTLKKVHGIVFSVRRVEADFLIPARFDDDLTVGTTPEAQTGARFTLRQDIRRGTELLFTAIVTLVALNEAGRAVRMPAEVRRILE